MTIARFRKVFWLFPIMLFMSLLNLNAFCQQPETTLKRIKVYNSKGLLQSGVQVDLHLPGENPQALEYDSKGMVSLPDLEEGRLGFCITAQKGKRFGSIWLKKNSPTEIKINISKETYTPILANRPLAKYREKPGMVEVRFDSEKLNRKEALAIVEERGLEQTSRSIIFQLPDQGEFDRYSDPRWDDLLAVEGVVSVKPVIEIQATQTKIEEGRTYKSRYKKGENYQVLSEQILIRFTGELHKDAKLRREWVREIEKKLPLTMTDEYLKHTGRWFTIKNLVSESPDAVGSKRESVLWYTNSIVLQIDPSLKGLVLIDIRNTLLALPDISSVEFWN